MSPCLWTNEQAQQWQASVMHYLLETCGHTLTDGEQRPLDAVTV